MPFFLGWWWCYDPAQLFQAKKEQMSMLPKNSDKGKAIYLDALI